jgi:hypothetical protein
MNPRRVLWLGRRVTINQRKIRLGCWSQWPRPLKALVSGRSLTGIVGLNSAGSWVFLSVVCCQVEVSASGWSLVPRSPTKYGVSECDRQASIIRRPWPTWKLLRHGKNTAWYDMLRYKGIKSMQLTHDVTCKWNCSVREQIFLLHKTRKFLDHPINP